MLSAALLACRVTIAVVFGVSGIAKCVDVAAFRNAVTDFGVPAPAARGTALGVIAAELAVSVSMLMGAAWADVGFASAIVLLIVFSFVIVKALRADDELSCHCFGRRTEPLEQSHLYRNVALLACSMLGLAAGLALGGHNELRLGPEMWIVSGPAAVAAAVVLINLPDIVRVLKV